MVDSISLSRDSESSNLEPLAMALHAILGLPIAARSLNKRGLRVERGEVVDRDFTGPVLEQVLKENKTIRATPSSGPYKGIPSVVTPIRDSNGKVVAALGVVDVMGLVDLGEAFKDYPEIIRQLKTYFQYRLVKKGPL